MRVKRTAELRSQRKNSSKETQGLIAKDKSLQQSARKNIALDNRSHRTNLGLSCGPASARPLEKLEPRAHR